MEQLGIIFLVILGIVCCLAVISIGVLAIVGLLILVRELIESIKE